MTVEQGTPGLIAYLWLLGTVAFGAWDGVSDAEWADVYRKDRADKLRENPEVYLGTDEDGGRQVHKARTLTFPDGYHLLVGRNISELEEMQVLIRKGLVRSILLTLIIGFVGGYISSRVAQRRFDRAGSLSGAAGS